MRVQRVGGVSQPLTLGPNETVSGLSGREQIRGFDVHFQPAHERLEEQSTPAAASDFMIHLAGPKCMFGKWQIQRCAICGVAIIKQDFSKVAIPDGMNKDPLFWAVGALVRMEGAATTLEGELPEDFKMEDLPKDFCLNFVVG